MKRVGYIGAPCSGKTVLAKRASSELSVNFKIETTYVNEYASTFVTKFRDHLNNGAPSVSDQYLILQEQLQRECEAETQGGLDQLVITDSPIFLNYVYATRVARPGNPIDRLWLGYIHDTMIRERERYSVIVVTPPRCTAPAPLSISDVQKRVPGHLDPEENLRLHTAIIGMLTIWGIPHCCLDSYQFEERVQQSVNVISKQLQLEQWSGENEPV